MLDGYGQLCNTLRRLVANLETLQNSIDKEETVTSDCISEMVAGFALFWLSEQGKPYQIGSTVACEIDPSSKVCSEESFEKKQVSTFSLTISEENGDCTMQLNCTVTGCLPVAGILVPSVLSKGSEKNAHLTRQSHYVLAQFASSDAPSKSKACGLCSKSLASPALNRA
ncbi:hypothetical protein HUJ05_007080 [Dendroctonus ponderosae]|nr:hypothetical protein HUJ05_007080 [Dendroctonus ponderosae]